MSKIYIAASSFETERVRHAATTLRDAGLEVVSTWWDDPGRNATPNPIERTRRVKFSHTDLLELQLAEVLWLLVPPLGSHSHGAFVELGFAICQGQRIISSGPTLRSIFCALTSEFHTDDAALEYLTRPFVTTRKMSSNFD